MSVLPQKFAAAKLRVKVPLPETGMVEDAPVRVINAAGDTLLRTIDLNELSGGLVLDPRSLARVGTTLFVLDYNRVHMLMLY